MYIVNGSVEDAETVLHGCVGLASLQDGRLIHALIVRNGLEADTPTGSALVDMYSKCRSIEDARSVFNILCKRNIFTWSAMMTGNSLSGEDEATLHLFQQMRAESLEADEFVFVNVLNSCSALEQGGYLKHGEPEKALELFQQLGAQEVDTIIFSSIVNACASFTAIEQGYAQHGEADEALKLWILMEQNDIYSDEFTFVSILNVCAGLATLEQGKLIHGCMVETGIKLTANVGAALVDMYAKCGSLDFACQVFDTLFEPDVSAWNAVIAAYAQYGRGLVNEGFYIYSSMMQAHDIAPTAEHYSCMVDLFGRAGQLSQAYETLERGHIQPNASTWRAILGTSRVHNALDHAICAAKHLMELEPHDTAAFVLLSNTYVDAQRWLE